MSVAEYLASFQHPLKAEIETLRGILLEAHPAIRERVKWKALSFHCREDLAAINPRALEYVQLIVLFPRGIPPDPAGLLRGDYGDRREIRFYDRRSILAAREPLRQLLANAVALIEAG